MNRKSDEKSIDSIKKNSNVERKFYSIIYIIIYLSERDICRKVYILDDQKQVVMVVGRRPMDVEPQLENITAWVHPFRYSDQFSELKEINIRMFFTN